MMGSRLCLLYVLSLASALTVSHHGWSQSSLPPITTFAVPVSETPSRVADSASMITKVYALADLGFESSRGQWITNTIRKTVEPTTWTDRIPAEAGKGDLSYESESCVLVVFNTRAVHGQIDDLLNELKKAMPQKRVKGEKPVASEPTFLQAQFVPDATGGTSPTPSQGAGYPVAAPLKQPKHLFHFIIRYEGEGVVDSNVVKFAKALAESTARAESAGGSTLPEAPLQFSSMTAGTIVGGMVGAAVPASGYLYPAPSAPGAPPLPPFAIPPTAARPIMPPAETDSAPLPPTQVYPNSRRW